MTEPTVEVAGRKAAARKRYLVDLVDPNEPFPTSRATADALEAVFNHLACDLLRAPRGAPGARASFDELRRAVADNRVQVSAWTSACGRLEVHERLWSRVELENNLRQIEVLVLALRSPVLIKATSVRISPTQQSGPDAEGMLGAARWTLEVFGGDDVRSNDKLRRDVWSLLRQEQPCRLFFACRADAYTRRSQSVPGATLEVLESDASWHPDLEMREVRKA